MSRKAITMAESNRPATSSGPTLIDVARVAGVSPITVSRALNRPEQVSEKTRQRVQQAVDQVGYIPNLLAGGLASNQSKLVALFVPTISHSIFADMVQATMDRLAESGYQSILAITGYSLEKEESLIGTVLGRRPDGLVLTGTEHTALTRKRLLSSGIPVVEAWDLCDDPIDMLVGFSHEAVGQAVAEHLCARGYQRVAVVSVGDSRAMRRLGALRETLEQRGITDVPQVILPAPATLKEGREGLRELLAGGASPQVVVCSSDTIAQGVMAEAASRGLKIPQDLAVIGFGDMGAAAQLYPALSTVRLDGRRVGRLIADALLQRFQERDRVRLPVRLDTGFELVEREST